MRLFFKKITFGYILVITLTACTATAAIKTPVVQGNETAIVTQINAACRNGQVFLTWKESPENKQNLRVYMSQNRITTSTAKRAILLTSRVEPMSGNDWTLDPSMCPRAAGPKRGWILSPNTKPLPPHSGLFVHTITKNDTGKLYFAVLGQEEDFEDLKTGINSLQDPVRVKPGKIQAIPQSQTPQSAIRENLPLALYLHPHTSRPPGELNYLFFGDKTMGWRDGLPFKFKVSVMENLILVEPYDRVWINRKPTLAETSQHYDTKYKNIESWWYGTYDNIHLAEGYKTGTPVNYTERILLWIIHWVQKEYKTDPARIYGFGTSMGTGIQRFALQNPNLFASVDVLVPILDMEYEMEKEKGNYKRKVAAFGNLERICTDRMPLSQRFNLVDQVCSVEHDLPFIVLRAGRQDTSVGWKRKTDYIRCMQKNRHGLLAAWDNGDHVTAMRKPIKRFPDFRDYQWHSKHFATNKSYPAFTNFTLDSDPGNGQRNHGDAQGFINYGLDWKIISDEPDIYQIVIETQTRSNGPLQVDITPRRRQDFLPLPGTRIIAYNHESNGKLIETKNIVVHTNGTITFEKFQLTSDSRNILTLRKKQ